MFKLKNTETGEEVTMGMQELLNEINRDRSSKWLDYNETDFKEGLQVFTEWELVEGDV